MAGESFQEFVTELRRLAKYCDFGANLNDSFRDCFVCGLCDVTVSKRLLSRESTRDDDGSQWRVN